MLWFLATPIRQQPTSGDAVPGILHEKGFPAGLLGTLFARLPLHSPETQAGHQRLHFLLLVVVFFHTFSPCLCTKDLTSLELPPSSRVFLDESLFLSEQSG